MNGLDFVNEIAAQVGLEPLKRLIDEFPKHRCAQSKRASRRNARVPSPLTRRVLHFSSPRPASAKQWMLSEMLLRAVANIVVHGAHVKLSKP